MDNTTATSQSSPKLVGAHVAFSRTSPAKTGITLASIGAHAGAFFTRSPQSDTVREAYSPAIVTNYKHGLEIARINPKHMVAHSGYIFNLATAKARKLYLGRLLIETQLAAQLDVDLVVHPGSNPDGDLEMGIVRVAEAINYVHAKTSGRGGSGQDYPKVLTDVDMTIPMGSGTFSIKAKTLMDVSAAVAAGYVVDAPIWMTTPCTNKILVEYMGDTPVAKNGSRTIGTNLEQLAAILARVEDKTRVGICGDTCHIFASGVNLADQRVFDGFMRDFDRIIGPQYLSAFHINDSHDALGSGKDHHAPIGHGTMGLAPFQFLMNHPSFNGIPLVTETHLKTDAEVKKEIELLYSLQK